MTDIKTEIATGVLTNLCEDAVKSLWSKVKKYFKDADVKEDIDLGIAYEKYLKQTNLKYGKIKTLIYNRVPRDLYSFYECTGLILGAETIDTNDINNVLKIGNKLLITGTGGIGKSTMIKHFFLNTISKTDHIPILIELRTFNSQEDLSIYNSIYDCLKDNGFNVEEEYYEYSLNEGGYIILLDGFDELNKEKSSELSRKIQEFADKYPKNHYIISSRPSSEFIGWHDYTELSTLPLTKAQAISMINKIDFDNNIKTKFVDELEKNLFDKHKSFAENPLLLTIMLLTYESNAQIPENLNDFYERAFLALFSMHDATKEAYCRETKTGLSYENFKAVFSYICFKSYFQDVFEFTDVNLLNYINNAKEKFQDIMFIPVDFQEDLVQHVCMLIKDGLVYRFSHRSFQEYFAALYTCKLTDDMQNKLITAKLKESVFWSMYYPMLMNMQRDRFVINVLLPGLKFFQEQYKKENSYIPIIKMLFHDITIKEDKNTPNGYSLSLTISNDYYWNIYKLSSDLAIQLGGVVITQSSRRDIYVKLMNSKKSVQRFISNNKKNYSIEELEELLSTEEINTLLLPSINRIKGSIWLYEKYKNNSDAGSSVDSILKDL